MPFAPSHGARIHYTAHGEPSSERVVVLIQGLGLASQFWFDIPQRLASDPTIARYVIAVDNRGTGASDKPFPFWKMSTMADDVIAVLDHAGVRNAVIVGISMGGMIAQHVALRHPDRVRGLVLMATTAGFLLGSMPRIGAIRRLFALPRKSESPEINLGRLLLPESKWSRAGEIFREWPTATSEAPTLLRTFAAHVVAASTHLVARRLSAIRCPTVVVTGEHDVLVPLSNAKILAEGIPGAELEVVPDAGHAVFADDRDLVRRMVNRLEQRIERAVTTTSRRSALKGVS